MNYNELKNVLFQNPNVIINILENLGAHHINLTEGKRIQFGLAENHSSRSHCIFLDNFLTHKDYPKNITEDFIKMVSRIKNVNINVAINYITLFFCGNIEYNGDNSILNELDSDKPLENYNKDILNHYPTVVSELFLNDGIPPSVQNIFGIRYSENYNRILIPIFQKNNLVGLFGRYNQKDIDDDYIAKYFPILKYQKGKVLFPYDINSEIVKASKYVFLVESEKTPMLTYKWGIRNIFALGGNVVKTHQIQLLKELNVKNIVLCLDKGLDEDMVQLSLIRLKEQGFNVAYVDSNNIPYLNNKDCIFDLNNIDLIKDTLKNFTKKV